MSYAVQFEIDELPKTTNAQTSMNWRKRGEYVRMWHAMVGAKLAGKKPVVPIKKAKLTLVRFSAVEPDFDGLVSGFKPIIDALIVCGVIEDDRVSSIGQSEYHWEKASRKKGFIRVSVREVE